ncbi:MAG: phosphatidate cytidylyltransferase [Desulfuromonadales bacterium]
MTGAILLPLLILFVLFADFFVFSILVGVITALALMEFYQMAMPAEPYTERWLAIAAGTLILLLIAFTAPALQVAGMTFLVLLFALFYLFSYRDLQTVVVRLALVFCGFFYVPLLLGHLTLLRSLPLGREWIFAVLLLVMAGDSAAYFTGIRFGRRKLYPAISPNKSIEGALGGLAGSVLGIFVAKLTFFGELQVFDCLLLGVGVGSLAQLGDLFESMLKRSFGVKDSGKLIPGHGGLLDRLDSLLFAFAPVYYYALWFFHY